MQPGGQLTPGLLRLGGWAVIHTCLVALGGLPTEDWRQVMHIALKAAGAAGPFLSKLLLQCPAAG